MMKNIAAFLLLLCPFATLFAQNVHINGTSRDSLVGAIRFETGVPLWRDFNRQVDAVEAERLDSTYRLQLTVQKPFGVRLMLIGLTTRVFITPGDNIRFTVERINNKPHFRFTGKNAANYNYGAALFDRFGYRTEAPNYGRGQAVDSFRLKLDLWYDAQYAFLDSFQRTTPMTAAAYQYFKTELAYAYQMGLCYPQFAKAPLPEGYFANQKAQPDLRRLDHVSYNSIDVFGFHHILANPKIAPDSLGQLRQYVLTQFPGYTRETMLSILIAAFAKKQQSWYHDELLQLAAESKKYVKDTLYSDYIRRHINDYQFLNKPMTGEVLAQTRLTPYEGGQPLTLAELLAQHKGKAVYINFWASWCGACREDHKADSAANAYLADRGVVQLYLSLDKSQSEAAWRKATQEDDVAHNQYLVAGDLSSVIVQTFGIKTIPRHIFLDKEHLIRSIDAVRPSDYHLGNLKMSVEPVVGKVVRFN
jgi:thiol-disulfide isomerase/thioredoxin